jgi:flagellin
LEINNNITSILHDSLTISTKGAEASLIALASGKKTESIEDAANMISAELMESEQNEAQQSMQNVQDGMSLLQTADSSLSSISDNIQKIRDLTLQRENGTYNEGDKAAIDKQITSLKDEINRVSSTTTFNDVSLLSDKSANLTIKAGDSTIDLGSALYSSTTADIGLDNNPLTTDQIDSALSKVTSQRSQIGALSNGLESTVNSLQTKSTNLAASQSTLIDTDIAAEASKFTQNMILQNVSTSLLAQANQTPAMALSLL